MASLYSHTDWRARRAWHRAASTGNGVPPVSLFPHQLGYRPSIVPQAIFGALSKFRVN